MPSPADLDRAREHKERGAALVRAGKTEAALHEYARAVALAPFDLLARRKMADLLARKGKRWEAIEAYQALAGRLAAEGRLPQAIALGKVILQLDPKHVETQETLARLYARREAGDAATERLPASLSGAIDLESPRPAAQRALPRPRLALPGTVELRVSELPATPLFSELPRELMQALLQRIELREAPAGAVLVREGERGHSLYVLASGSVDVVRGEGAAAQVVDRIEEGAFFGEIGLVADVPRLASVVAREECMLLEVTRELVDELTVAFPWLAGLVRRFYKERLLANLLRQSQLLAALDEAERYLLAGRFEVRAAAPGEALLAQGGEGKGLFVLLRGRCAVSHRDPAGADTALPGLAEGAVFGEISLLEGGKVTATVTAAAPCVLLTLSPEAFAEHVLGNPEARKLISALSAERLARTDALDRAAVPSSLL